MTLEEPANARCVLCGRQTNDATDHHLFPKSRARGHKGRKRRSKVEEPRRTEPACRGCHRMVHALFSTKELERDLNTVEKLKAHPEMAEFIEWVRDRPMESRVQVRRSRGRS